jgi:general nucleoside transport system ATP-binding protein
MAHERGEIVLEARHLTKQYPGVVANRDVSLTLRRGEVLALLGENGAGKSTLMHILYGLVQPDAGEILVRGRPVRLSGPRAAIRLGIGMVHQHFMLVPVFTVAENIILGDEPTRGPTLDLDGARRRIRAVAARHNLAVEPDALVRDLSVGEQQRVEIVKALYRQAEILFLDEPTAVLTPREADHLFAVIRDLTARGVAVIFISHKLREVLAIADRIMVLRRGEVVGETTPAAASERALAEMMVGRDVALTTARTPARPGATVLEARDLTVLDDRGQVAVDGLSLTVRAGEILGIAGVQGNGQTELVEAITGLRRVRAGQVRIDGRDRTNATPRQFTAAGGAHVPEDRQEDGLVLTDSIADNLVLNTYDRPPFARGPLRDEAAILANARTLIAEYDVRARGPLAPVATLSGGNRQKVVMARELARPVRLLVAAQPTRGLDVGSIEFIHRAIVAQRDRGAAVLLVSAELDEILGLADRIAVMYHGRVVAVLPAGAGREEVGLLMAGARPAAAGPAEEEAPA